MEPSLVPWFNGRERKRALLLIPLSEGFRNRQWRSFLGRGRLQWQCSSLRGLFYGSAVRPTMLDGLSVLGSAQRDVPVGACKRQNGLWTLPLPTLPFAYLLARTGLFGIFGTVSFRGLFCLFLFYLEAPRTQQNWVSFATKAWNVPFVTFDVERHRVAAERFGYRMISFVRSLTVLRTCVFRSTFFFLLCCIKGMYLNGWRCACLILT